MQYGGLSTFDYAVVRYDAQLDAPLHRFAALISSCQNVHNYSQTASIVTVPVKKNAP